MAPLPPVITAHELFKKQNNNIAYNVALPLFEEEEEQEEAAGGCPPQCLDAMGIEYHQEVSCSTIIISSLGVTLPQDVAHRASTSYAQTAPS